MPEPVRVAESPDALASLEERILQAVQVVTQLRREKEAAEAKLGALKALEAENSQLRDEVELLREERTEVRQRIEKLLGQMEALAS